MTVWRTLGLGLCGLLVLLTAWTGRDVPEPRPADGPVVPSATSDEAPAARLPTTGAPGLLAAWDRRRAAAWSAGDAGALRRLYVPGSRAGRADVGLLQRYAAAGVRVRRLTTQVFSVEVLHDEPGRRSLRVVDRVAGGELVRAGRLRPLASGPVETRRVELVRHASGWRVGDRAQRLGERPSASTARTSGSWKE